MSGRVDFRWRAREHLEAARQLLASDNITQLRYACLELRMCIEALTYDRLGAYLDEVSIDAMKKWQPRQVIEEMLEVDPYADQTVALSFGEEKNGVPPRKMRSLGEDRRLSVRQANSAHNALGNFL